MTVRKSKENANDNGYTNVEFVNGDIDTRIPVEDNTADLVISNCVINLTADNHRFIRRWIRRSIC